MVGEAAEEDVIYRSGARPGDLICVTGNLGAAYAGLKILLEQHKALQEQGEDYKPDVESFSYVIHRQLIPTARTNVVEDWAKRKIRPNALIDISDGLASEVHHICRMSGVGAHLYGATLPIDLQTREVADYLQEDVDTYALFGGEDYELLFTVPLSAYDELKGVIGHFLPMDKLEAGTFTVVGEFTEPEEGIVIKTPEGGTVSLQAKGYQHFN